MTAKTIVAPSKPALKRPALYKVIFFDDDVSTFQAVINIAVKYFNKNEDEAYEIAFRVNARGSEVAGIYSKDIAKTKINLAEKELEKMGYPLKIELFESI